MLIRFSVTNFRSFKDEIELNMIPSKERSHRDQVYRAKGSNTTNLVRGAVVYGANASGKSNLVEAMSYAKDLITRGKAANKKLDLPYFKLDPNSAKIPARFEFEIQCNNKMYAYGFELLNTHIVEEWLYLIKAKQDKKIFTRKKKEGEDGYHFASSVNLIAEDPQFVEFVERGTRPNQLFLAEAINRNLAYFSEIYHWFGRTLQIVSPTSFASGIELQVYEDNKFSDYLTTILDSADTGITKIRTEGTQLNEIEGFSSQWIEQLQGDLDEDQAILTYDDHHARKMVIAKRNSELWAYKLSTVHGDDIAFDLAEESDGTRRLIELTAAFYDMADEQDSRVYIIDEIDRSLHPHLTRLLIKQHLAPATHSQSQLIVTTHETALLDVSLIRRDEIWFMAKDESGGSKLYSLSDFQPRYDKDIRKDYLLGRYGAIPFVGDISRLKR